VEVLTGLTPGHGSVIRGLRGPRNFFKYYVALYDKNSYVMSEKVLLQLSVFSSTSLCAAAHLNEELGRVC
jgi:hypothetical protein